MKTRDEIAETKEKEMGRKEIGGGLKNSRTLAGVVDVICSLWKFVSLPGGKTSS